MDITVLGFIVMILFPLLGAPICYYMGRKFRYAGAYALQICFMETVVVFMFGLPLYRSGAVFTIPGAMGLGLSFSMSGLQFLLVILAALLWLASTIVSREQITDYGRAERYHLFSLLTMGSTIGVFLAADLYTMLVFFEIMSFSSWPLVHHAGTEESQKAADSYLAFAVIGGLATLMGLFLLYHLTGTLSYESLPQAVKPFAGSTALYVAGTFAAVSFAAKAAVWPLHTWLPSTYPAAPSTATALLSGILTKAGVYGFIFLSSRIFAEDHGWGSALLLFSLITMVTGAVLGVFSVNLKRTLACSSMSQIGFILTGVAMACLLGEENGIAVAGLTLHMVNHSLFKLTLFLCAGVVFHCLGELDLNRIRGFGRGKPLLMFAFGMGGVGLAGVPLFSGYISKTLLHESIVEYIHLLGHHGGNAMPYQIAEWVFLFSGGLTAAYMTKLFICLFVEKNSDPELQASYDAMNGKYMKRSTAAVIGVCGACVPLLGLTAHQTMDKIAAMAYGFYESEGLHEAVHYFSLTNLKGSAISLCVGAVVYLAIVRPLLMKKGESGSAYVNLWPSVLDIEKNLYVPALRFLSFWGAAAARFAGSLAGWAALWANKGLKRHQGKLVFFPEDEKFAVYEAAPAGRYGFTGSLAFSLFLFCLGFTAVVLYMLFV